MATLEMRMAVGEQAAKEIDSALARYGDARKRSGSAWLKGLDEEREENVARMSAVLERWAPPHSSYVRRYTDFMNKGGVGHSGSLVQMLPGWLAALKQDYLDGTTASWEERLRNAVFGNLLGLAAEILPHSPDAAALIAGSVLEEHLRKLTIKAGLDPLRDERNFKKVEILAQDLVKADVLRGTDHRAITAWYGIRNDPAHAKFGCHRESEVSLMIQGINDFIGRLPA